jgi:hypothetical protein
VPIAPKILVFVEDPGAVNFLADLPQALAEGGASVDMTCHGHATGLLERRSVAARLLPADAEADAVLHASGANLVLVGTSENKGSLGLGLIDAARDAGIPTVAVVDGPANPGLRFRGHGGSATTHAPDRVLVPDAATRQAYIKAGFSSERTLVCGHPHWDILRRRRQELEAIGQTALRQRLWPRLVPGQRVIVFAAEISDGLKSDAYRRSPNYTLFGTGNSIARTDIVIEEVLAALNVLEQQSYKILRLHPKNSDSEFEAYRDAFDAIDRASDLHELCFAADLVVGMTSILLLEALLLGRPVLSVVPWAEEKSWLSPAAAGLIPCVWTPLALVETLRQQLTKPTVPESVTLEAAFPAGACQRVCAVISALLPSARPTTAPLRIVSHPS